MEEDGSPVGMGEKCGDDVGHKDETHGEKDFFEGLKIAIDRQIPEDYRNGNHKPDPRDASDKLKTTANSRQVCRDQGHIGDDEQERGDDSNRLPVMLA